MKSEKGLDSAHLQISLKDQIQKASGSSMPNIAEGFDAESNAEFMRFLCYVKRSCSEVQSVFYIARDMKYISPEEFQAGTNWQDEPAQQSEVSSITSLNTKQIIIPAAPSEALNPEPTKWCFQ